MEVLLGIMIPFIGTVAGASLVLFMKNGIAEKYKKILLGFASGVMIAASFFSLLLPALEQSEKLGKLSFIPAAVGFLFGILFLLALDVLTPHMHLNESQEGPKSKLKKTTKLFLAVTIHNIPEGMAVGIVYAGWLSGSKTISLMSALALAIGIAIQNFPEGAIVSLPLKAEGMSRKKTFLYGVLSGIVEPVASIVMIFFSSFLTPILPYLLAFAAGAMFYVIIEELIPETAEGSHSNLGTIAFAFGFVGMMILDVAIG